MHVTAAPEPLGPTPLDAALAYAARGWPVLPLHRAELLGCSCHKPGCPSPGKHPRVHRGLHDATVETDTIRGWWERWPDANVGLRTGVAFDVLDVDGAEGAASLRLLTDAYGPLPPGPRTTTGGGGMHIWFAPTGIGNKAGRRPHIDWRGAGGYVVAPPSNHASGGAYTWAAGMGLAAPVVPDWLRAVMDPPRTPGAVRDATPAPRADGDTPYGRRAFDAEVTELAGAAEGTRNATLNACAFNLAQLAAGGELDPHATLDTIRTVALRIGLEEAEVAATLASGWGDGFAQPRSAPRLNVVSQRARQVPAVARGEEGPASADQEGAPAPAISPFIDWAAFWAADHDTEDWIAYPLIPRGRQVVVYAPPKTGKSLLSLDLCLCAATGRAVLGGETSPSVHVMYLDYEMTEDDLHERMVDLGYSEDDDLSHFHYALQPPFMALDTAAGGEELAWHAAQVQAELVVVDTFGRAVSGDENDADTVRAFYRHSGIALKRNRRSLLRIDHSGKDPAKGQRGTSAKNDDVDVVWQVSRLDEGLAIRRTHSRVRWVPETVTVTIETAPILRHVAAGGRGYVAGTRECCDDLDRLGVPWDATVRTAMRALKEAGCGRRNVVVQSAVRFRMREYERLQEVYPVNLGYTPVGGVSGYTPDTRSETASELRDTRADTPGYAAGANMGPGGCIYKGYTPGPSGRDTAPAGADEELF